MTEPDFCGHLATVLYGGYASGAREELVSRSLREEQLREMTVSTLRQWFSISVVGMVRVVPAKPCRVQPLFSRRPGPQLLLPLPMVPGRRRYETATTD